MKNIVLMLIILLVIIGIIACSRDHRKTELPGNIEDWSTDKNLLYAIEKLSDEEKELFAAYAFRRAMSGLFLKNNETMKTELLDVKTLGAAIEFEKSWREEQAQEEAKREDLRRKIEHERKSAIEIFNEALTVSVLSLEFRDSDFSRSRYSDDFVITIGFDNHTAKDMIGVKGVLAFKDVFGDLILRTGVSMDQDIPAGKTYRWVGTIDYNRFLDSHRKLRTTDFEKMKIEWEPEVYLISDGSELRMPD